MGGPPPHWGVFLAILALGSAALATAATLVGAVIAQTRGRAALFAGVSFPLLLPLLAAAVSATRAQWTGAAVTFEIRLLAAFTLALLAASLLLYDHLWED
jgi:heme exporter protein B